MSGRIVGFARCYVVACARDCDFGFGCGCIGCLCYGGCATECGCVFVCGCGHGCVFACVLI